MSKFKKRVQKSSDISNNALVVGLGQGHLEEILEIYKTVFLINSSPPTIKAKNLIYRQEFGNLNQLTDINTIFVDTDAVDKLEELTNLWQRNKSAILIEGDDPIPRDKSGSLYNTGWGCTSTQGFFHVWKQIK